MAGEGIPHKVKIGVAGWSYEDWDGTVYPPGLKPGLRLPFLLRYFDCIEINSTFYATPRAEQTARWAETAATDPGFTFTCKLVRTLTHGDATPATEAQSFRNAIEPLLAAGKLGAVLAQFPWFFRLTPESFDRVRALGDLLSDLPLVLELRHRSFLSDEFLGFLSDRGIGLAAIDLPATRTSLPAGAYLFGSIGYFRFHGRNREAWFDAKAGRDEKYNYLYNERELSEWVPRIRSVAERAEKVFVIANNHFRGQAPANAVDLAYLLGEKREAPEPLAATYPHLARR